MNITGNILYEYRVEETYSRYRDIKTVSVKEFLENIMVGDIILSKVAETDPSLLGLNPSTLGGAVLREFQKSPINSTKMYIGNNLIAGYSAAPGLPGGHGIVKYNIKKYLEAQRRVVCIRPYDYTEQQRERAASFIKKRIGLGYDNSMIIKSFWHRFRKKIQHLDLDPDSPEMDDIKTPLICSSMVALAIIYSGNKTRFGPSPYEVWPVDLLMSPDVELPFKIARND